MSRTVHRAQAAIAAGVPYSTLQQGKYQGDNVPAGARRGGRAAEKWTVSNVLAVRVCRVLEYRLDIPLSAMTELFQTLFTADEADLRRLFREGRRFVMIVGKQPCGKAIFTAEEISANPMIDYRAAKEAGLPLPQGLDIEREYNHVVAGMMLDELKEEAQTSEPTKS